MPSAYGGGGLGLTEACLVLEAQGRRVAPGAPLGDDRRWGPLRSRDFAPEDLAARWLPGVVTGEVVLTAALTGTAESVSGLPVIRAERDGKRWRLTGTELGGPPGPPGRPHPRPGAHRRGSGHSGAGRSERPRGARLEHASTTNREVHPHLHCDGVAVEADEIVAGPEAGAEALGWTLGAAWTGLARWRSGSARQRSRATAEYVNERHQFDRALSTFQAVMLRAADAAIDVEAMRVTLWQAAWRIDTGRPAAEAVAVAKWVAAERGQRVVHATQHLHGGIGADVTYPIHRYFLWGKQLELQLGGPSRQLVRLGRLLADRARSEVAA